MNKWTPGYFQYGIKFSYERETFHHICNINLPNCQWFSCKHIGQGFLFIGGIFYPVTFHTLHTCLWYDPWFSQTSLYPDIAQSPWYIILYWQKFPSCNYESFLKYFTGLTRSWRKKRRRYFISIRRKPFLIPSECSEQDIFLQSWS